MSGRKLRMARARALTSRQSSQLHAAAENVGTPCSGGSFAIESSRAAGAARAGGIAPRARRASSDSTTSSMPTRTDEVRTKRIRVREEEFTRKQLYAVFGYVAVGVAVQIASCIEDFVSLGSPRPS